MSRSITLWNVTNNKIFKSAEILIVAKLKSFTSWFGTERMIWVNPISFSFWPFFGIDWRLQSVKYVTVVLKFIWGWDSKTDCFELGSDHHAVPLIFLSPIPVSDWSIFCCWNSIFYLLLKFDTSKEMIKTFYWNVGRTYCPL